MIKLNQRVSVMSLEPVLDQVRTSINFVSLREGCFYVGIRTHGRDTFLCAAKEKYPKERPPSGRLFPALLAFVGGLLKGYPSPQQPRFIPESPLRAIPAKSCDARRGQWGGKSKALLFLTLLL
jgi:hypothetical protein